MGFGFKFILQLSCVRIGRLLLSLKYYINYAFGRSNDGRYYEPDKTLAAGLAGGAMGNRKRDIYSALEVFILLQVSYLLFGYLNYIMNVSFRYSPFKPG